MVSQRRNRGTDFGAIVDLAITDVRSTINGIEFLESPQGPRINLLPVQRVIFKATMGIPMDFREHKVEVWDDFREKILYTLSERDYLRYVHSEGRCNFADWRDLPQGGFSEVEIVVGRRGGKALGMDEPVPTPNGWVLNRDLKTGDYVFGPDGLPTRVVAAHEPFRAEAYRLTFDDGTSVVAHGEHLWKTETKADRKNGARRKPVHLAKRPSSCATTPTDGCIRTTEEIRATLLRPRPDGKVETNHSIPLASAVQLPEAELPLDPYFLGLWLGDGSSRHPSITTMDPEVISYLEAFANTHGLKIRKEDKTNGPNRASTYHVTSRILGSTAGNYGNTQDKNPVKAALRHMGLLQNKHIPEAYLWASQEQRLALLQGLMDTDGGCHRARCEFSSKLPALAQGVYHLAASLGLKPNTTTGATSLNGQRCADRTRVTWTDPLPVFKVQRKLDALPRKVKSCQLRRFIVSVEPIGEQEVRCITVEHSEGLFLFGKNFNVTHNSVLASALAVEKLRQLLNHKNPHEIYRLVDGDPIDFTVLAQDEDGAGRLYDKIKQAVNRAEFFRPFTFGKPGVDSMQFITEADRVRRSVEPSLQVSALACTTRSARGPSNYFLVMDEFAHFRSATGARSDEVYEAATPSTARFIRREKGQEFLDSLVVTITSPWTKVGKTYDLMKEAMRDGNKASLFYLQCSSAEMAGREISSDYLRTKYRRDPVKWQAEYGGKFLESAGTFIPMANIKECTDEKRGNAYGFDPRRVGITYFWGTDLGFTKDATALAICHWEQAPDGRLLLIYDYIDRRMVGEGKYKDYKVLPVEDILDWFWDMNQWLPGKYGYTDQYAGAMFVQLCKQRQLDFMELVHLTSGINSEMYYALQGYLNQQVVRFPNNPTFIHELGTVEAYYVGKHQIKVEAPNEKDAHDDLCDAVALAAWGAQKWMLDEGAKHFAFSGNVVMVGENELRPGDLGVNPELSTMSQIRVAERMRTLQRMTSVRAGTMPVTPRMAARRGRF